LYKLESIQRLTQKSSPKYLSELFYFTIDLLPTKLDALRANIHAGYRAQFRCNN
jgi:hypothetical protein